MLENRKKELILPTLLKCENCWEPVGIDNPNPEFSWELRSDEKLKSQTSYWIQVAGRTDFSEEDTGLLWDTGKVYSDDQFGIVYRGAALECARKYWWRVTVWDEAGNSSGWSETASFVTGFFTIHEWVSRWFDAKNDAVFARKDFQLPLNKTASHAFLYVAALGNYCNSCQIRLNGKVMGESILFPGPTEYLRALYQGWDVTEDIRTGMNTIGLVYTRKSSALLVIRYEDGSMETVGCDDSWRIFIKGPFIKLANLNEFTSGRDEEYDARLELNGWDTAGYPDHAWKPYVWKGWWTGPLYLTASLVPCKIADIISPVTLTQTDEGKYMADFGRNMAGFAQIWLEGPEGTDVFLRYAERLNSAGQLDTSSYTFKVPEYKNRYIMKGTGCEFYRPTFMYTGFRYVEISGDPAGFHLLSIEACSIHSDVKDGSVFRCSDERIQRLQNCAVNSFLSNLVNIPTDCPGRERRGWTADAMVVSAAHCVNFDVLNFYKRWFRDISDCQLANGWIPVELPLSTVKAFDIIWPCASVLIPWDLYATYRDIEFLKTCFPIMQKYVGFLSNIVRDDCIFHDDFHISFGDWVASESTSKTFISAVFYYAIVERIGKIATLIGNKEEGLRYSELAAHIKGNINRHFLKSENGKHRYDNNSQGANAYALFFDIVPENIKPEITNNLVEKIKENGTNTTGFLGTMCILEALTLNGRKNIAFALVENTKLGGWIYMVDTHGLTTLAEDYCIESFRERYLVPASLNHAFLGGSLSAWFYRHLAGVTPISPGYKKFRIQPYFAPGIKSAGADIHTRYGIISVDWRRKAGEGIILKIVIPVNTTAEIQLPELKEHSWILGSGEYAMTVMD